MDFVDEKSIEEANADIKRAKVARKLEGELNKLKVEDLVIDRKLERTKSHFKEMKNKLKSWISCFQCTLTIVMTAIFGIFEYTPFWYTIFFIHYFSFDILTSRSMVVYFFKYLSFTLNIRLPRLSWWVTRRASRLDQIKVHLLYFFQAETLSSTYICIIIDIITTSMTLQWDTPPHHHHYVKKIFDTKNHYFTRVITSDNSDESRE